MKKIKKLIFITLLFIIIILIFRNNIYNIFFSYKEIECRANYNIKNRGLQLSIDSVITDQKLENINHIVDISLALTQKHLEFKIDSKENDPNNLFSSHLANCIGYAAYTAAIGNYLIEKGGLKNWKAQPVKGWMFLFKQNLHEMANNPSFKDHDFVVFRNSDTKEEIYIDPSVYEYLRIKGLRKHQK